MTGQTGQLAESKSIMAGSASVADVNAGTVLKLSHLTSVLKITVSLTHPVDGAVKKGTLKNVSLHVTTRRL